MFQRALQSKKLQIE